MAAIEKTLEHITKLQITYVDTLILIIRQHFRTISTLFLEYAKLRKSAKFLTTIRNSYISSTVQCAP